MRCPPELLDDLAAVFAELRTWPGVVEKRPAIFYVRREPFLHFHADEARRRRADIKGRDGWHPFELPHPLSATRRRSFLRELRRLYGER